MKTSILFILFLLLSFTLTSNQAQTKWFKYAGNPVLEKGESGEWDSYFVNNCTIIWDGTEYKMWYAGNNINTGLGGGIGYATSVDGISWEKYTNNPVLEKGTSGEWDSGGVYPTSILFDGTFYKMWYRGFVNYGLDSETGYATSSDGINWTKDTLNNPVLTKGESGSWDSNTAWGGDVNYENSIYKMWYHGNKYNTTLNDYHWQIGYAESEDGIEWTKRLEPVMEEAVDEARPNVVLPFVVYEDNKYSMWYHCTNTSYNHSVFNYATSPDGLEWNKSESNPILTCGSVGTWDGSNIWKPSVIKEGNLYKMWYSGEGSGDYEIGYAEDFSHFVHADSVTLDGIYFSPNKEPLFISGRVLNPEGHALTAKAVIVSDDGSVKDSVEVFDDGLNGDGNAGDGIYGGYWQVTNEKNYTVGIKTVDELTGFTRNGFNWHITDRFTSKGPIEFERLEITSPDTVINPGDRIKFSLTLKSLGITDTVYNVKVRIIIMDSTIANSTTGVPMWGDIAPGESLSSWSRDFALTLSKFGDSCSVGLYEFGLEISSNSEVFWYDTFTIEVVDVPNGIEDEFSNHPRDFSLEQNYPNPFNPETVINYSIPNQSYVTLKVFDILGREIKTLVNKKQSVGNYEVEFDASGLTSGIYFYRIQAGQFIDTKKMILMK